MKSRIFLAAVAAISLVATGALFAEKPGKDVKCPVSNKAVNPDASVQYDGGTVYFCCNNCPKAFKASPDKFKAKAHHQMAQTGQLVQVACPLTGKPTNPATEIDVQGVKVAFCCNGCKGKALKAKGDKQIDLIFSDTSKGYKKSGATN